MTPTSTVMMVDSDFDTRLIVCDILEDDGYTVVNAATGIDALLILRAAATGFVVLLDASLPDLPGTVLLRTVADELALQRHQYILCTTSARLSPVQDTVRKQAGAALLVKPFDVDELVWLVADAAARLSSGTAASG